MASQDVSEKTVASRPHVTERTGGLLPSDRLSSLSESESEADGLDDIDDAGWEDVEPDEESMTVVSLFDSATFPDLDSMFAYCREKYDFDFMATRARLGLDFHGAVKLCNFIRSHVRDGVPLPSVIAREAIESDGLLIPVIADDALIILLDEVLEEAGSVGQDEQQDGETSGKIHNQEKGVEDFRAANLRLESEIAALQEKFSNYKLFVEETLDRRWGDDAGSAATAAGASKVDKGGEDVEYWESYAGRDIHEIMLKDAVRTNAYRDFVYGNKDLFKDKIVLDIGCGTGILSLFCAKAGAKRVLAVDNSAIISKARENVFNNGLADVITCVSGRIEDVTLPVPKVDIIISEWMGYCLLYEAMLPSILWARDKYLQPDGLLVPSHATIWAAPVSDEGYVEDNISFWKDVYGFNMTSMQEGIYDDVRMQHIPGASLCGQPFPVSQLRLHQTTVADLTFKAPWATKLSRDVDNVDGFLVWFDIFFARSREDNSSENMAAAQWADEQGGKVAFTTGPSGTETHWRQGLLLAPPTEGESPLKSGSDVVGDLSFAAREKDARALKIDVRWSTSADGTSRSRSWLL